MKKIKRLLELIILGRNYCDRCDSRNVEFNSYDKTVCRSCGFMKGKV